MKTNTAVMDSSVASLANAPQQQRSRELTTRILEASLRLLQRADTNFTIRAVANEAGVSVGGICGRFADRDELLCAVHSHVIERLENRVRNNLAKLDMSIHEALQGFIAAVAVTCRDDGVAIAKLQTEPIADRTMKRAAGGVSALHELLGNAISRDWSTIMRPDRELALHTVVQMVLGTLTREVTFPYRTLSDQSWASLCEELEIGAYAYLTSRS